MNLGRNIRNSRKKMNLTQYQLAELIEKDVSTISKIETNSANPSILTLHKIAKALKIEVSQLLES